MYINCHIAWCCQWFSKAKDEPAILVCKERAENGE